MGTRVVLVDLDTEATPQDVGERTGPSVSEELGRGVAAEAAVDRATETPYEILSRLDLGPGGYAVAPSGQAKQAVARAIRDQHGR